MKIFPLFLCQKNLTKVSDNASMLLKHRKEETDHDSNTLGKITIQKDSMPWN